MRVIITGGLGFIGSSLCRFLINDPWQAWEILVVDDLSSGHKSNKLEDCEYMEVRIDQPGIMDSLVKSWNPEIIFHLAAIPRVAYSVEHPLETTDVNVMGTIKILEAVRKHNKYIRIINTSSSSVYGGAKNLPTSENSMLNPQSPYGLQKMQAEQWCKMYSDLYDMDIISLRYFNVFGPYSVYGGAYSTVSGWLYSLYVDEKVKPFLEGDGTQSRDFCYVDNAVNANVLAATCKGDFHGECLNIAQGDSHTLLDCKNLLEEISGKKLDLEMRPTRVGDVKHTLADISKAQKVLGYNPSTDFEKQVKTMADWYKNDYVS